MLRGGRRGRLRWGDWIELLRFRRDLMRFASQRLRIRGEERTSKAFSHRTIVDGCDFDCLNSRKRNFAGKTGRTPPIVVERMETGGVVAG